MAEFQEGAQPFIYGLGKFFNCFFFDFSDLSDQRLFGINKIIGFLKV
jgi:hypothetical protein